MAWHSFSTLPLRWNKATILLVNPCQRQDDQSSRTPQKLVRQSPWIFIYSFSDKSFPAHFFLHKWISLIKNPIVIVKTDKKFFSRLFLLENWQFKFQINKSWWKKFIEIDYIIKWLFDISLHKKMKCWLKSCTISFVPKDDFLFFVRAPKFLLF